ELDSELARHRLSVEGSWVSSRRPSSSSTGPSRQRLGKNAGLLCEAPPPKLMCRRRVPLSGDPIYHTLSLPLTAHCARIRARRSGPPRAPERSRLDLDRGRGPAPEEAPGDETAQRRRNRASRLGWPGGSTPPGERVEERVVTLSLAKPAERERRQSRVQCDLVRIICPHSRP